MAGTTLTGSTPATTYDSLLKVTSNGPVTGSLQTVTDGLGNDSALQLSSAGVKSTGTLDATGVATLSGGANSPSVGATTPGTGAFTALTASTSISCNSAANAGINATDGTVVGIFYPSTLDTHSLTIGTVSNHSILFLANNDIRARVTTTGFQGRIGFTTPSTGAFTALNLTSLPTSSSGLVSGDVWNDSGVLKIV